MRLTAVQRCPDDQTLPYCPERLAVQGASKLRWHRIQHGGTRIEELFEVSLAAALERWT